MGMPVAKIWLVRKSTNIITNKKKALGMGKMFKFKEKNTISPHKLPGTWISFCPIKFRHLYESRPDKDSEENNILDHPQIS